MNNIENNSLPTANVYAEKKSYVKPELKKFGSLSELVQNNIGIGTDGNVDPDCTFS